MGLGYKCLRARLHHRRRAEQSLRRLQVDAIDLYQSHWDDDKTPFEETLEAYARLIRQGKVKAIGASNLTAERLAQALDASRRARASALRDAAAALQPVRARQLRRSARRSCACARDIGVITYFSLGVRVSHRQVPQRGGLRQEPARAGHAEVPEPARTARSWRRSTQVAQARATRRRRRWRWRGSCSGPGVTAPIASATSVAQLRGVDRGRAG